MTLVVDASAFVAIALGEPERLAFADRLAAAPLVFACSVNVLEAGLVIVARQQLFGVDEFAEWLAKLRVTEIAVAGQAALRAYLQYGKGFHRTGLNMGDCFAYALSKQLNAPLLYKGNDFALTDVQSALQPT